MRNATFSITQNNSDRKKLLNQLLDDLLKRSIHPQDRYEIAVLLETMGWNDKRVYEAFRLEGVFELAEEIWELLQQKIVFTSFSKPQEKSKWVLLYEMLRSFLRGLLFALPMAISVFSMLSLKFSLWSYENLSVDLATCIAIATILSFLLVGGFTQAIARRGFFYLQQGYYNMGRRITFYFIRLGYILCALTIVVVCLINIIFNLLPYHLFLIFLLYFVFLTLIWLSVTVMYILRKEFIFSGLILLGIFIVFVLFVLLKIDILFSQLIAIAFVALLGMVLSLYFFKREEKREEKGIVPKLPRLAVITYLVMPYFIYGFLYFFFLYVDRVMAWSANSEFMPFFIWFRGDYELGLDFALLALMLPLGVSEVVVNKMMQDLEDSQKGYSGFEIERLCRHFLKLYHKWFLVTAVASVVSCLLVFITLLLANDSYYAFAGKDLLFGHTTYFVFICALIAYLILAMALMNAVILFSLSQPKLVNRAILPAIVVNAVVGFLLSRWFEYSYGVFGLLAGTIVFAILSYRQINHVLRHLDEYLFAAL